MDNKILVVLVAMVAVLVYLFFFVGDTDKAGQNDDIIVIPHRRRKYGDLPNPHDVYPHFYDEHKHKFTIGSREGEPKFEGPWGVAVCPLTGNIAVSNVRNHEVQVMNRQGFYMFNIGGNKGTSLGQFDKPKGVAFTQTGNIYVVDQGNHRVQYFDMDGLYLAYFGYYGDVDGALNEPQGIAIDKEDLVYVCDSGNLRINVYTINGDFVRLIGNSGPLFVAAPIFVALTSDDKIVVSDDKKGVYVFTKDEKSIKSFPSNRKYKDTHIRGLATDPFGGIIVGTDKILMVYDEMGRRIESIGERGMFDSPRGLGVTVRGNILVCDMIADKIHVFGPSK